MRHLGGRIGAVCPGYVPRPVPYHKCIHPTGQGSMSGDDYT